MSQAKNSQEEREDQKKIQRQKFKEYAQTRDKDLRDELIEDNLYIAEILAKRYVNRGIEYDDIFQVASIGLINAVERFDPSMGYEFSSFATPTIVGEIKRYFRDKGWTIRVPRRIQELSGSINNARVELAQTLQRSPSINDIAQHLGYSEEEIIEAMEASQVYSPQSLDLKYDGGEDSDVSLGDLIGVEESYYTKIEDNDFIDKLIENLDDDEKKVLIDRYYNMKTQSAIADEMGISQMTVSRMEKKILEKMRNELRANII